MQPLSLFLTLQPQHAHAHTRSHSRDPIGAAAKRQACELALGFKGCVADIVMRLDSGRENVYENGAGVGTARADGFDAVDTAALEKGGDGLPFPNDEGEPESIKE